MRSCIIYDDIFLKHNFEHHSENAERLRSLMVTFPNFNIPSVNPTIVSRHLLEKVHDRVYISEVEIASSEGFGYFDSDTYVTPYTFEAALYAAGANELAVELVKNGNYKAVFCPVRPPGHHAEKRKAMGFCIFNNVVIAAFKALEVGFNKVFIVDFDAHHGNGTQHLIESYENIFYFSTHQYPFYPGTGSEGENDSHIFNIPLDYGTGDSEFVEIYKATFLSALKSFNPDIILVSAGFDFHKNDPLTGLLVTDEGMKFVVNAVFSAAKGSDLPIILTLEGGYNLEVLKKAGSFIFENLSKF